MKTHFKISTLLPASTDAVYKAWLCPDGHSNMTGGAATASDEVGGNFTAWDGYISGKNLELVPNEKIVQSWRTTEFSDSDEDSKLTLEFKDTEDGCELTLTHENIPEGSPDYEKGWDAHYFTPMREFFNN